MAKKCVMVPVFIIQNVIKIEQVIKKFMPLKLAKN